MKILMATSEFSPLGATGDLGDQVRILTTELRKLGHDVSVVMPFYRSVREGKYEVRPTNGEFQVSLGGKRASSDIVETTSPEGIQVYLIRRDEYFDRSGIYGADGRIYEDNAERFIFFSKAVLELAHRITPSPELIHCHDWTSALIPVFARDRQMPFRTVLTVHNLEHQGSFWSFDFALTGLPGSSFRGFPPSARLRPRLCSAGKPLSSLWHSSWRRLFPNQPTARQTDRQTPKVRSRRRQIKWPASNTRAARAGKKSERNCSPFADRVK